MTPARIFTTVVTVVAVGWAIWTLGARAAVTVAGDDRAASPVEQLQRAILEANIDQPGDPALAARFGRINTSHFGGRLQAIPVRWEPRLAEVGVLAGRSFTLEGMFGHVNGHPVILLDPDLAGDVDALDRALCHEIVHAFLWTTGEASTQHGPRFQAELERLAAAGAFTGILATQAERDSLRVWIESERSRLDSYATVERTDAQEMDRERADLERAIADLQSRAARPDEVDALTARRDAYNRRVTEARERADRGRADVTELNRQIDRYNLMQSYPDGMDDEKMAPATPRPVTH